MSGNTVHNCEYWEFSHWKESSYIMDQSKSLILSTENTSGLTYPHDFAPIDSSEHSEMQNLVDHFIMVRTNGNNIDY